MRSPTELTEVFRERGLKVTPQRQCIFRVLAATDQHPTAEDVYASVRAEMPTVSLRTVYQTLNDLVGMGELAQLDVGAGSRCFDPTVGTHHHLVCDHCGSISDVDATLYAPELPPVAAEGFEISATEVVFRGRCRSCAAAGSPPATAEHHPTQSQPQEAHQPHG